MIIITKKGSSCREKVAETGSIFMDRFKGMGRGSAGLSWKGMGRGRRFKGMNRGQGFGKVDGQGQCRGMVERHGQG